MTPPADGVTYGRFWAVVARGHREVGLLCGGCWRPSREVEHRFHFSAAHMGVNTARNRKRAELRVAAVWPGRRPREGLEGSR